MKEKWKDKLSKEVVSDIKFYTVLILCLGVFTLVHKFIVYPSIVSGASMEDNFHNGNLMICARIHSMDSIERFDVVTADWDGTQIVKRVVGLPGETIQIVGGAIFVDGERIEDSYGNSDTFLPGIAKNPVVLGEDEYFLMGDNRNNSDDSRFHVGVVTYDELMGKVLFKIGK